LNENLKDIQEQEVGSYQVEVNSTVPISFFSSGYSNEISMETLKSYIKYPMVYNEVLREISELAYNEQGIYANAIDYMVSIPLLSKITTLRNNDKIFREKKKKFNLMLELLNHDRTTRDILRTLFIDGTYVGILRDTVASNKNIDITAISYEFLDRIEGLSLEDNFMIQPLDLDYCKIVGFQNNISVSAFDMMYFDQFKSSGLLNEIKNFPKEFVKAYNSYKKDASKRWFILDPKKTIALKFKAKEDEPYGRPLGLSAFANMKANSEYGDGQYKLISELASSIYMLLLPEGLTKGSCSLNKDQQGELIDAFRNAVRVNTVGGAKISTLSLPPSTKIERLSKDSSLLKDSLSDENMKKISTDLGFAVSALNASSEGGASYSSLQVNIDLISSQIFECVNETAVEMTRVLNQAISIQPKDYIVLKYLPVSWLNKDSVYDKAKELFTLAGGSRKFMIASAGFDVDDYLSCLDEEIEDGLDEKYPPHITSYTSSDSADKSNPESNLGGRKPIKEADLKPAGATARNLKSNEKKVTKE